MKLRAKNLLIFGSIWVIIILSVFLLFTFVLVRGFKHKEFILAKITTLGMKLIKNRE